MHRVGQDDRALSEIVGALMLIVIVAVSATTFAAFFHKQQEKSHEQKALEADRRLEAFQILSIKPEENDGAHNGWDDLTFQIASAHINPSQIMTVLVNNEAAAEYELTHFDSTVIIVPTDEEFPWVEPREIFEVSVDVAAAFGATEFEATDPIEFTLLTHRGNRVSEVFFPPTAIIILEPASGGGVIMDASRSDYVGVTGRIVRWEWDLNAGAFQYTGRVVRSSDFLCDGTDDVTLTVIDNFGMKATDVITDFVC